MREQRENVFWIRSLNLFLRFPRCGVPTEAGPGAIARQHAFERGILALIRAHRIVNDDAKLSVKIERGAVGLFLIGFSHDVTEQVCAGNPAASIPGRVLYPITALAKKIRSSEFAGH